MFYVEKCGSAHNIVLNKALLSHLSHLRGCAHILNKALFRTR